MVVISYNPRNYWLISCFVRKKNVKKKLEIFQASQFIYNFKLNINAFFLTKILIILIPNIIF